VENGNRRGASCLGGLSSKNAKRFGTILEFWSSGVLEFWSSGKESLRIFQEQ